MNDREKAVFDILWKRECYNGITHRDIDDCRKGSRYDMGARVERYEQEARDILAAIDSIN